MKIAIMQPYFLPYIGYWQLISAVDTFVILDDVSYIKRGYISSNNILVNGSAHKFTISVSKQSQNKNINETKLYFPVEERKKLIKTIMMAYKKAPYYNNVMPLLSDLILFDENDLTRFIEHSITMICNYLSIDTRIILSSNISKDTNLKGEARIIEINKVLNSDVYINAIGGKKLYSHERFVDEGINLFFLKTNNYRYTQFNNEFVPNLSIVDLMMFNNKKELEKILENYFLVE